MHFINTDGPSGGEKSNKLMASFQFASEVLTSKFFYGILSLSREGLFLSIIALKPKVTK